MAFEFIKSGQVILSFSSDFFLVRLTFNTLFTIQTKFYIYIKITIKNTKLISCIKLEHLQS